MSTPALPPLKSMPHSLSSTPRPSLRRKGEEPHALRSKSRLLLNLQHATSVKKALHYLQLRDAGWPQASAIGLSKKLPQHKTDRLLPPFRPYVAREDFINYDAIDAAYNRFEEQNVIVKGMVQRKKHVRASSDVLLLSTARLRAYEEEPGVLLTRQAILKR